MKNKKLGLIFIIVNIIVLISIAGYYLWRLVYYYKIDHPKIETKELYELLTLEKNIVSFDDGLYKEDDKFVYKGNITNNYVRYSGLIFRVYEITKNEIKLISLDTLTVLNNNINFNNSDVKLWLEDLTNSFNKKEEYLNVINYCYNDECTKNYFTMLSKEEYENSLDANGFINNKSNFWLIDNNYENSLIVDQNGDIILEVNEFSGVRMVISLKKDINIISGNGTMDNPYIFEKNYNNVLSSKNLGEYVDYNNQLFRIIEKDENSVKILMNNILEEKINFNGSSFNIKNGVGKYLNNEFLDNYDDFIIESQFYVGKFNNSYKNIFNAKINAKVGLPKIGDLFISDYDNIVLINGSSKYLNTIYSYQKFHYYADSTNKEYNIRPVISIKGDIVISKGNGTINDPYIVEGDV